MFIALLALACAGPVGVDEDDAEDYTAEPAEVVEHVTVTIPGGTTGQLCPESSPHQLYRCETIAGREVCIDGVGGLDLVDGCLCFEDTANEAWICDLTLPDGYEYRLSWWAVVE